MTSPGRKLLVVTNDFPPRPGGIQSFVAEIVSRLPADRVVVLASSHGGDAEYDALLPFPVVRYPHYPMVPTPGVARLAQRIAVEYGCTAAWFGAAAPLALLTPSLRRVGVERVVATTHGHEAGWAAMPVARSLLRRIGSAVDVLTCLGSYTESRIRRAVGPGVRIEQLTPGVDVAAFRPDVDGAAVRARYGLEGRPVVGCISRLVPRKGQDMLIEALPLVQRRVPDAALLIGSGGPDLGRLRRLASASGSSRDIVFTGPLTWDELPPHFATLDVFAMPCRTRRFGMDVEGLGIVYLEASATGRPVVAGRSGGAPDAVLDGETGYVVDGSDVAAVAARIADLLEGRDQARVMGERGREWTVERWRWETQAERLASWLSE